MEIKFRDFTLRPGLYAKDRWDLVRTKNTVMNGLPSMKSKYPKAKIGDVVGTSEEEMGYDLLLENAIHKAISYLLADKDDVTDLRAYVLMYRKEKEELESLFK